jgi:uncharacterized protein (DUF1499 family)
MPHVTPSGNDGACAFSIALFSLVTTVDRFVRLQCRHLIDDSGIHPRELAMNSKTRSTDKPVARWLVRIGFILALLCVAAAMLSGLGYRLELWGFRGGFGIIKWAFQLAIVALILSLVGLAIPSRRTGSMIVMGLLGIVIGGIAIYVPWNWKQTLDAHPYIHDITTDLNDPPAFVVVASVRGEGDHPVTYDGPEVAAQQREAYPELQSLIVSADPATVFAAAKKVVDSMGMELVDASESDLRIEATQTSFFYGFKDDIVVRIVAVPDATKVDVRSKSRVGRSDIGQNAKRIKTYLAKLKSELDG